MGIFSHFSGSPTVARLFSAPDQKVHGTYDPNLPLTPIYSESLPTRWNFKQFFNGYVRGPEGTSLSQFQQAVAAGQIPGVASDAVPTFEDYIDSLYLMASNGSSFYDAYVRPDVVDPGQPPAGGDPCADVKAQLQQTKSLLDKSQANLIFLLSSINSAANKARKVLPAVGGGKYAQALRALIADIDAQVKG